MKKFGVVFLMSFLCLFNLRLMSMDQVILPNVVPSNVQKKVLVLNETHTGKNCWHQNETGRLVPLQNLIDQEDDFLNVLTDIKNSVQDATDTKAASALPIFSIALQGKQSQDNKIQIIKPHEQSQKEYNSPILHQIFSGLESGKEGVTLFHNEEKIAILYSLQSSTTYNPNQLATPSKDGVDNMVGKNKVPTVTNITFEWQQQISVYELKEGSIKPASEDSPNTIQLTLTNSDSDNKPEQVVHITLEQLKILSEKTTTQGIGDNNFAIIKIDGNEVVLKLDDNIRKTFEEKHRVFILQQSLKEEIKVENPTKPTTGIFSRISSRHSIGFLTLGFATTILGFYAISKLEYWNKGLAPAMEDKFSSLFNHLYNAFQGTLSRTSQN